MSIQLLVSVRNAKEAEEAIAGGADIVDIKDPGKGSLGYAGTAVISSVIEVSTGVTASAALGELNEWTQPPSPQEADVLSRMSFLKTGPCGLAEIQDWKARHEVLRTELFERVATKWVAVAYADHDSCAAPAPMEILTESDGCAGLLIDTYRKAAGSTFDCLSAHDLRQLRERAHDRGMFFALAGRVQIQHMEQVAYVEPDIVGVRGAACEQNNRTAALSRERVQNLKTELSAASLEVGNRHFTEKA